MNAAWAGALFGFALSAKSWPIILLPVLLAILPTWRQRLYGLVAAGAVPLFFLVTLPLVVDTSWANMLNVARYLGEVRPIVGEWGWTAVMTGGDWKLASTAAGIGQIILYSTILLVMWLWWRSDRIDQTSAILLAFMVVTPRMGAQYLLWFVPFLCARPTRWSRPAMTLAAVWAGLGYIYLTQFDDNGWWKNHEWWSHQLDRRDPVPDPGDAVDPPRRGRPAKRRRGPRGRAGARRDPVSTSGRWLRLAGERRRGSVPGRSTSETGGMTRRCDDLSRRYVSRTTASCSRPTRSTTTISAADPLDTGLLRPRPGWSAGHGLRLDRGRGARGRVPRPATLATQEAGPRPLRRTTPRREEPTRSSAAAVARRRGAHSPEEVQPRSPPTSASTAGAAGAEEAPCHVDADERRRPRTLRACRRRRSGVQGVRGEAVAAGHGPRGQQGVHHGLLGGLDHAVEERVEVRVGERVHVEHPGRRRRRARRRAAGRGSPWRRPGSRRRWCSRPPRPYGRCRGRRARRAGGTGGGAAARPSPRSRSPTRRPRTPAASGVARPRSVTGTPSTVSRSRRPWLACRSTPTVQPPSTTRDAVPMPPLKPWQIMPVPPPTSPSATGPPRARACASRTCSAVTCRPSMSLRTPSQVSPTTGRPQAPRPRPRTLDVDQRVADDADAVGVGQRDRRGEHAAVADPRRAGQLAVAVEPVEARVQRLVEDRARRAAGPRSRRCAPGPRRPAAARRP